MGNLVERYNPNTVLGSFKIEHEEYSDYEISDSSPANKLFLSLGFEGSEMRFQRHHPGMDMDNSREFYLSRVEEVSDIYDLIRYGDETIPYSWFYVVITFMRNRSVQLTFRILGEDWFVFCTMA